MLARGPHQDEQSASSGTSEALRCETKEMPVSDPPSHSEVAQSAGGGGGGGGGGGSMAPLLGTYRATSAHAQHA